MNNQDNIASNHVPTLPIGYEKAVHPRHKDKLVTSYGLIPTSFVDTQRTHNPRTVGQLLNLLMKLPPDMPLGHGGEPAELVGVSIEVRGILTLKPVVAITPLDIVMMKPIFPPTPPARLHKYEAIATSLDYHKLVATGMAWEIYPDLETTWEEFVKAQNNWLYTQLTSNGANTNEQAIPTVSE